MTYTPSRDGAMVALSADVRQRQAGFSLVELLVMLGIAGIVSAMAVVQFGAAASAMRADGGMRVVMGMLNNARELAISQRRYVQVQFLLPNQIRLVRTDVNSAGTITGTTVLSTVPFESGVTFIKDALLPDTPDAFGMATAVNFGTATTIQFATDGQLVDQTGNALNGTVVVASPNSPDSSRAVTVFGSTGRVRAFRWNGRAWVQV